jgi:hypothetical protein
MVFAAAGRRIDADGAAPERFPLRNTAAVEQRVREFLQVQGATAVVTSAACGADLILLAEAGRAGIRRRIILPYDRGRFRETSVTDRSGDWGPLYDRILDDIDRLGDLATCDPAPDDAAAYAAANQRILQDAASLARESGHSAAALLIWDGRPRESGDFTLAFKEQAVRKGFPILTIGTIEML